VLKHEHAAMPVNNVTQATAVINVPCVHSCVACLIYFTRDSRVSVWNPISTQSLTLRGRQHEALGPTY